VSTKLFATSSLVNRMAFESHMRVLNRPQASGVVFFERRRANAA
jgi:hypothetical protein